MSPLPTTTASSSNTTTQSSHPHHQSSSPSTVHMNGSMASTSVPLSTSIPTPVSDIPLTTRRISSSSPSFNAVSHAPAHQQPEVHKSLASSSSSYESKSQQDTASHHPLYRPIDGVTLMIDNYDSFTYNIVQYLSELGATVTTIRNDTHTLDEIIALNPARLVVSPGPGNPSTAGISKGIIRYFAGKIPVLGVCLGHQSMIEEFGGLIVQAPCIMHGKTSSTQHDGLGIWSGIPDNVLVTRYHSLCGEPQKIPSCFIVTSSSIETAGNLRKDWSGDETRMLVIQGVRHREYAMEGVQFHPESITTQYGYQMLHNFLTWTKGTWREMNMVVENEKSRLPETIQRAV